MSNNPLIKIEYASVGDLGYIALLEKDFFSNEAYSLNIINNIFNQNNKNIIVSKYNDFLVGYMIVGNSIDFDEILKIAVLPNFRNKKIGKQLLSFLIDSTKKDILLEVSIKNENAIHFYLKNGFIKQSVRPKYYSDGSDALLMAYKKNEVL